MELIVLDNGLIGKSGHSYNLAKIVSETLSRRNLPHRIFGMCGLDPSIAEETGAIPHFSRSLYECADLTPFELQLRRLAAIVRAKPAPSSRRSEAKTCKIINQAFEKDLLSLPKDVWNPDNLVALPAITQNQIFGLVRFLLSREQQGLPAVVCHLMFPPSWLPWANASLLGEKFYSDAFGLAAGLIGRHLYFTAENEAMQDLFSRKFGIGPKILPLPFGAPGLKKADQSGGTVRLGFLGDSRCEKGFHLLPAAIELCQREGLDVEYIVQIQHAGLEERAIEAERSLRAFKGVRLVEGVLTSEEYGALASEIDVMLLPYDPAIFGLRGSGIFTESVAAGRPVIATEGTFAAACIEKHAAEGEVFAPCDSKALAAAVTRLLPRLPECRARAAERAREFARCHSGDAFIDVLLSHVKGSRPRV